MKESQFNKGTEPSEFANAMGYFDKINDALAKKDYNNAKKILAEINKLDEKLSSVDKYYVKTKKKKEELLSDTTSDAYDDATDYFKTLGKIKDSFKDCQVLKVTTLEFYYPYVFIL